MIDATIGLQPPHVDPAFVVVPSRTALQISPLVTLLHVQINAESPSSSAEASTSSRAGAASVATAAGVGRSPRTIESSRS